MPSKALVIDTDIVSASGEAGAQGSRPKACREFLENVLEICHRVVLTDAIKEEWNRHQSKFSRIWRRSMYARKKVIRISVARDEPLRRALGKHGTDVGIRNIMLKDAHLIEAAHSADLSIVSLDETARSHFKHAAKEIARLAPVLWVNPEGEDEDAIGWLKQGAPYDDSRKLEAA